MGRIEKTVFISYRRVNASWALAIFQNLTQNGYDVFFDFTGIASGDFETVILENIRARAHFLALLTPSALERCTEPTDWLRREIETALDSGRNIVPLMLEGFDFSGPAITNQLSGKLSALKRYNALRVPADYFSEAMERLRERFLNAPLDSVLQPASSFAQETAREHQAAAHNAPEVQDTELRSPAAMPPQDTRKNSQVAKPLFLSVASRLSNALGPALGPLGRDVAIRTGEGNISRTRDGLAIVREFDSPDPLENMTAKMIIGAAKNTRRATGDGAKTTILLIGCILNQAAEAIRTGGDLRAFQSGLELASKHLCGTVHPETGEYERGSLQKATRPLTDENFADVLSLVSGDKGIGRIIVEAHKKVGKDGVVTVRETFAMETTLDVVEGMQFDRGYLSWQFITDQERMECIFENALILIHERKISSMKDLLPLLEQIAKLGKPLLIIAEEVEGEALATLVVNKQRGTLQCAAVKAPGFGDRRKAILADIAVLTGGKAITEDLGIKLENVKIEDLGKANKITIDKDKTTIVEGAGRANEIEGRVKQIRQQIEVTTSDYDREKLQERLAKLVGGIAVIKVGAETETLAKAKAILLERAVLAARSAVEYGVTVGGGIALLRAGETLGELDTPGDQELGKTAVWLACQTVLRQLLTNSGQTLTGVVDRVLKGKNQGYGFDAVTRDYRNLFAVGIVDPANVCCMALRNAVETAVEVLSAPNLVGTKEWAP